MQMKIDHDISESSFSAVVTRADGTIEDLGIIAYYNKNPLKLWAWKIKHFFKHKILNKLK